MATQPQLFLTQMNPADAVYTPEWVAQDMIRFFDPVGRILEPCKGTGQIFAYLPEGADFCEITEGRDFYAWTQPVDWIISNPPYSDFIRWIEHSYSICENIVYLLPLQKVFNAFGTLSIFRRHGWIRHVRVYGTGSRLNFPMGNAIGACWFQRGYEGDTSWSWYE